MITNCSANGRYKLQKKVVPLTSPNPCTVHTSCERAQGPITCLARNRSQFLFRRTNPTRATFGSIYLVINQGRPWLEAEVAADKVQNREPVPALAPDETPGRSTLSRRDRYPIKSDNGFTLVTWVQKYIPDENAEDGSSRGWEQMTTTIPRGLGRGRRPRERLASWDEIMSSHLVCTHKHLSRFLLHLLLTPSPVRMTQTKPRNLSTSPRWPTNTFCLRYAKKTKPNLDWFLRKSQIWYSYLRCLPPPDLLFLPDCSYNWYHLPLSFKYLKFTTPIERIRKITSPSWRLNWRSAGREQKAFTVKLN